MLAPPWCHAAIEDAGGDPADQLRLICTGTQMEDGRTLGEFRLEQLSIVKLVPQLRGD